MFGKSLTVFNPVGYTGQGLLIPISQVRKQTISVKVPRVMLLIGFLSTMPLSTFNYFI